MRNVLGASRNVCDCSDGARRSATAQCLDIDECTEYPGVCGNNSVCTNTDGNYTCACGQGYRQIDGEEVRCILATDSSALAIGLTVCGMFLLNIIILVVVVLRRRNRRREYESEDVSFKMEEKRSCVTRPAYEDVTGQSVQQKLGVSNLTCPESVILPEESSVTSVDDRYEDVDLPSQPELFNLI
ncbi:multiple epidermal growth factor-like domains protein 6 [Liolophura sinensis]|uniref:multiple epidermal growth factor-like domains protein 6 n=1 Tax=Liolophura sinensis TaxID=3198878 RepID=UPI0031589687